MGKLSAKQRDKMPRSEFAGPDKSYPVNDRSHAANAKARASQAVNAGRMSKAEEAKIDAKANRVLDEDTMKRNVSPRDHMRRAAAGRVRMTGK